MEIYGGVASVLLSSDNSFEPGHSLENFEPGISNLNDATISTQQLPEGTMAASACSLGSNGTCTSQITWNSTNVSGVNVYVIGMLHPGATYHMASSGAGAFSAKADWITNQIYVFFLIDDQGHVLDSVTFRPGGYTTLN